MSEYLSVVAAPERPAPLETDEDRAFGGGQGRLQRALVDADVLRSRIQEFLATVEKMLADVDSALDAFSLAEITLRAEVSAKGTVSLFGSGGEVGGTGGLEFKFVRKTVM